MFCGLPKGASIDPTFAAIICIITVFKRFFLDIIPISTVIGISIRREASFVITRDTKKVIATKSTDALYRLDPI